MYDDGLNTPLLRYEPEAMVTSGAALVEAGSAMGWEVLMVLQKSGDDVIYSVRKDSSR